MKIYLDHIGIACDDFDSGTKFWNLLGLTQGSDEIVANQGVITRFFATSENADKAPMVELLKPTEKDTPIGKFLAKRGPGVQQICFRVENIIDVIKTLKKNGIQMVNDIPEIGANGAKIAFVHPKSTGGVLVELAQKT
tara:strand:+ start:5114 stop:5527 length:414 start_codon:yes stop_codon:yes gene_type:complete